MRENGLVGLLKGMLSSAFLLGGEKSIDWIMDFFRRQNLVEYWTNLLQVRRAHVLPIPLGRFQVRVQHFTVSKSNRQTHSSFLCPNQTPLPSLFLSSLFQDGRFLQRCCFTPRKPQRKRSSLFRSSLLLFILLNFQSGKA